MRFNVALARRVALILGLSFPTFCNALADGRAVLPPKWMVEAYLSDAVVKPSRDDIARAIIPGLVMVPAFMAGSSLVLETEASALIARMSVQPDSARKAVINDLVLALKTAGIWTKLDCLWILAAHDAQAARLNWIQSSYSVFATGSPTFTTDRGYTTGATGSNYLGCAYNPSGDASAMAQNSAHISIWSRTSGAATNSQNDYNSGTGGGRLQMAIRTVGDQFKLGLNSATQKTLSYSGPTVGHFVGNRTSSTATEGFYNGTSLGTMSVSSSGLNNSYPDPFSTTGREFAAGSVGGGLTSGEVSAFYNALQTYMTAVGA